MKPFQNILILVFLFLSVKVHAFPNVSLISVSSSPMGDPIHHGLVIQTSGIQNANLTSYEVQIKPDGLNPLDPRNVWQTYSASVKPIGKVLNLPYRNGIYAMKGPQTLCLRIRALYGQNVTSWASQCGIQLVLPTASAGDQDGDGISDATEYAMGLDPRNPDTDGDDITDGEEQNEGSDPLTPEYPNLMIRTAALNFGTGDILGQRPNQHSFILIENTGRAPAHLQSIQIVDNGTIGASASFKLGSYPSVLSHLPLHNRLYLPVSFLPQGEENFTAQVEVASDNPNPLTPIPLTGNGVDFPHCRVTPASLDFGEVSAKDQAVLTREVTISNRAAFTRVVLPGRFGSGNNNNPDVPFGFTLSTTNPTLAPAIRGFVLKPGEEITIPILFQHPWPGDYDSYLEIRSAYCGTQRVELKAKATE